MAINREKVDSYTNSIAFSFGNEVIRKRQQMGISRRELARTALISYKWLVEIEKCRKVPSVYVISSLSMALDFYDWEALKLQRCYSFKEVGNALVVSFIAKNPLHEAP